MVPARNKAKHSFVKHTAKTIQILKNFYYETFLKKKCVLGKSIEAIKLFKLLDPFVDFNKKGMPLWNLKKDKDTQTHCIVFLSV